MAKDYFGRITLSVFSVADETMPLWEAKERLQIEVHDPDDPDYSWSHVGMDGQTARKLNFEALDLVRRVNDNAVLQHWFSDDRHLLMPHLGARQNIAVEKAVERIGMAPRDFADVNKALPHIRDQLEILAGFGVVIQTQPRAAETRAAL